MSDILLILAIVCLALAGFMVHPALGFVVLAVAFGVFALAQSRSDKDGA